MKRTLQTFLLIIFTLLPTQVLSQESIINEVLESQQSFITIKALQIDPARPMDQGRYKMGSGVILSSKGIIVTNLHTIIDCNIIKVKLFDNKVYYAKVLTTWPSFDLALIKIQTFKPLVPIGIEDSNSIKLGQDIINVSSSKLWQQTITGGIITGLGVSKQIEDPDLQGIEMIEINLNLDKGDSGGPLLDKSGNLIGMITAKDVTRRRKSYAIPSNKIHFLLKQFDK